MEDFRIVRDDRCYPVGTAVVEGGVHFSIVSQEEDCSLVLYRAGRRAPVKKIPFPKEGRIGDVWSMTVTGDLHDIEYCFEINGQLTEDPFGRHFTGREIWGSEKHLGKVLRASLPEEDYDWEGDEPPQIPYQDCILYRLHPRGFTKHPSSKVKERGTFAGIIEKIPYLAELGVTTIELMPSIEFQEVMSLPKELYPPIARKTDRSVPGRDEQAAAVAERTEKAAVVSEQTGAVAVQAEQAGAVAVQSEQAGGVAVQNEQAGAVAGRAEKRKRGREEQEPPLQPSGKLNYWGFIPGLYLAPKASYCSGKEKHPEREFKDLVKALHKAGMELVMDLFFTGEERETFILEVLRTWAREYHVDGFHLIGAAPCRLVGQDPYLSRVKLWAQSWEGVPGGRHRHLAEYNEGFAIDMKRFLKGDEGQLNALAFRIRYNPKDRGQINYMANINSFTLLDNVSYDVKHNEANGENNLDGSDYNYSWNCGVEGPSRKKKVVEMRRRLLRASYLLLFLSQGTPLLMAGDEFGNSQNGNNNPYCQDNEVSWLNWKLTETNKELLEFVKKIIRFRKAHPMFHLPQEPRIMDYLSYGQPDVSYHGIKAWCPEFENFRRQLGVLYCGRYAKRTDGSWDDHFYVAYNMHWEPHEFSLPNPPKGQRWHIAIDTGADAVGGIYPQGEEVLLERQKHHMVGARTIIVFVGKKVADQTSAEEGTSTARSKKKKEA